MASGTGLSSTDEVGLVTTVASSNGALAMPSPGLVDASTFARDFLLVTACDDLSLSAERFGADLFIERAGSSKIRMGPNADRLDVVVESWTVDVWGATFRMDAPFCRSET